MAVLLFVVILGLLIFVHELGHFLVARRSGIRVEEFGFGFPPRLWGRSHDGVLYSLNAIPFGGFVRLHGENGEDHNQPDSFSRASWWRQLFVLAAGVLMNYLLAWVLLSATLAGGVRVVPSDIPARDHQYLRQAQILAYVSPGTPAALAGLKSNDVVRDINEQNFSTTEELVQYTSDHHYPSLQVNFQRANQEYSVTIHPLADRGTTLHYGFGLQPTALLRYPWYIIPWAGLRSTATMTGQTFAGFGTLIKNLALQGRLSTDVTGPVGIAVLTKQVSALGWTAILQFVAILSISLAVINFLPLPALDGGRALFVLIARARGQPVNRRVENIIHTAGFYLLISLVIAITIRDIQRFGLIPKVLNVFH